jgi:hypothetical protein
MEAYFGLGGARTADQVEVRFQGGSVRKLVNVPANRILTVDEDPQLTRR